MDRLNEQGVEGGGTGSASGGSGVGNRAQGQKEDITQKQQVRNKMALDKLSGVVYAFDHVSEVISDDNDGVYEETLTIYE